MSERVAVPHLDRTPRSREVEPGVLVVDDDGLIRAYLVDALEEEGYPAIGAANGTEAIEILRRRQARGDAPPRLILLDMRMPVMDGWAFARAYRALPGPHAPIVVITAAPDAAERAEQVAADGVLAKPFDLDQLLATVARFVEGVAE